MSRQNNPLQILPGVFGNHKSGPGNASQEIKPPTYPLPPISHPFSSPILFSPPLTSYSFPLTLLFSDFLITFLRIFQFFTQDINFLVFNILLKLFFPSLFLFPPSIFLKIFCFPLIFNKSLAFLSYKKKYFASLSLSLSFLPLLHFPIYFLGL